MFNDLVEDNNEYIADPSGYIRQKITDLYPYIEVKVLTSDSCSIKKADDWLRLLIPSNREDINVDLFDVETTKSIDSFIVPFIGYEDCEKANRVIDLFIEKLVNYDFNDNLELRIIENSSINELAMALIEKE